MNKTKILSTIFTLTFIFTGFIGFIYNVNGEVVNGKEYLGIWDTSPFFEGKSISASENFDDNNSIWNFTSINNTNIKLGAHASAGNQEIIKMNGSNVLYITNETFHTFVGDGYGGANGYTYASNCRIIYATPDTKNIEFDYYNFNTTPYNRISYYPYGVGVIHSDYVYVENYDYQTTLRFYNNGTAKINFNTDTTNYINVSSVVNNTEKGWYHIAFGHSFDAINGLTSYVIFTMPNGKTTLYYITYDNILTEPTQKGSYGAVIETQTQINNNQYYKGAYDNFVFYNETASLQDIKGITSSSFRGFTQIMPILVISIFVTAVVGLFKKF